MSILKEDTIAAISTSFGAAGIGKIRISGPKALEVADRIFQGVSRKSLKEAKTYTAHYGHVIDPDTGKIADEVITIIMRKPHSFTGEDVVEFDCHGGMVPLQRVLELILKNGARLAEPGEFSKRAFLNGRLDLAQAEGIIEVINSKTEKGLDVALNHLNGRLSVRVDEIKEMVIEILAHLEASIDFPEDEIEGYESSRLGERLTEIKEKIEELLATSNQGKIYQEGIKTVIVGKPNVGKSSLLNTLLEEKRAIVTDVPGTTRDIIEEYINIKGVPLKIIDTAGIRETQDMVEKIGVEKARESLKKADLILMMLDVSQGLTETDLQIYDLIKDKPVIIVVNKTDLEENIDEKELNEHFAEHPLLKISIKEEKGLEELKNAIIDEVLDEELKGDEEVLITRTRHRNALERSLQAIKRVIDSFNQGLPNDFLTIDLKDCLDGLGEITGETVTEDIIDRIFADFCLGK
ncbi:MAG: tRNA modification GTPase [Halanaerobiales bacterium]|nr:tRNA modification GTPase [Halanaerobiales bacterium]